jgi:adenosylmethionine-8-amino-7-oxononanoate aminotransferase
MWAAALHPDQDALEMRLRLHHRGVIVRPIGDHTIVFCPPLVTTDDQIDRIVDAVAASAQT